MSQYAIVIEGDGSTNYSAYTPDLPGVVATGDTLEECEAEMREAIDIDLPADLNLDDDQDRNVARLAPRTITYPIWTLITGEACACLATDQSI